MKHALYISSLTVQRRMVIAGPGYSQRKATAGSIRTARRNGNQLATIEAIVKNKVIAA
jgi:hypothetical protein